MDAASQQILEAFAARILDRKSAVTVQTTKLAREGYDVGMVMDLVAEYMNMPRGRTDLRFRKRLHQARQQGGVRVNRSPTLNRGRFTGAKRASPQAKCFAYAKSIN